MLSSLDRCITSRQRCRLTRGYKWIIVSDNKFERFNKRLKTMTPFSLQSREDRWYIALCNYILEYTMSWSNVIGIVPEYYFMWTSHSFVRDTFCILSKAMINRIRNFSILITSFWNLHSKEKKHLMQNMQTKLSVHKN